MTGVKVSKTRASLLIRVKNLADSESWREFVDLYGPMIFRYLRRLRVSHEDCLDLAQDVLEIVAKHIPRFDYDPTRGTFRGWLYRITMNRARRFFVEKSRAFRAQGGTAGFAALHNLPDPHDELKEVWDHEWRRRRAEAAMRVVRAQVGTTMWRTFELAVLEGLPTEDVARRLNISTGQVYVNKCRVVKRLRQAAEAIDD